LCTEYLGGANTATLAGAVPEAENQRLRAALDELRLKLLPVQAELALVTNLTEPGQEKYFSTSKPDSTLVLDLAEAANALTEWQTQRQGYGPSSPMYQAGSTKYAAATNKIASRLEALVWALQKEEQELEIQVTSLQALMNKDAALTGPDKLVGIE